MITTLESLNDKLDKLSQLRGYVEVKREQLKRMEAEADGLKSEIARDMHDNSLKSYRTARVSVTYATKKSVRITEPLKVLGWLEAAGFNRDEYTSVDTARAKPILEQAYKTDGEIVPGTEATETSYIRLKDNQPQNPLEGL